MMHRTFVLALLCCAVLLSIQMSDAMNGGGDDARWNNHNLSNNDNDKNPDRDPNEPKKKKNKKNKKKKNDDDQEEVLFQTSFTFIPRGEIAADPKFLKMMQSPWNDKGRRERLQTRIRAFVRDHMIDGEKIDRLAKRTRKEWEDLDVAATVRVLTGTAKILANILNSPSLHKLLNDRDVQEKIRLFLVLVTHQIQNFLNDPLQQVIRNPDEWHALFDNLKLWEGIPHEEVLEELLNFFERDGGDHD